MKQKIISRISHFITKRKVGALTQDFLKKNLLLPIPLSEINYNEGITVDDNNFGY